MDIHLLERLKDIVRSAGTTVRSAQDAAMGIREKSSHVDLVTLYDPMVQEFLRSRLMTLLPEADFFGEEGEHAALTRPWTRRMTLRAGASCSSSTPSTAR